jgi:hypothetical protein
VAGVRSAAWTNVHHVIHWSYRGATTLENVTFVRGDDLVAWLCGAHSPKHGFDVAKVGAMLDRAARQGLGPRSRTPAKGVAD